VNTDSDDEVKFDEHGRLVIALDESDAEHQDTETDVIKKEKLENKGAGRPLHQPGRNQKGRKLGEAYKARKAGGDVRKKGQKFDPYAYVPLDGRSYTKKNRRNAVEQLDAVVRGRKRQKK
jgi:ribosomal RNA-processing protein 12